jgi:hypothetical protein
MILDPCTWESEGFLLAIGGFPQEYHLRPSPGGLISSLQGAWVVLDGIPSSTRYLEWVVPGVPRANPILDPLEAMILDLGPLSYVE